MNVCGGLNRQIHAFCRLAMSGEILLLVHRYSELSAFECKR
jgi:hypothetical protein